MRKINIGLLFVLLNIGNIFGEMIASTDFESVEVGSPFVRPLWTAEGFSPDGWDDGLQTRTMIDDSAAYSGLHSMRIVYPENKFGTQYTGCQVSLRFPARDEAYMSYSLRFSENFSWGTTNFGGKLPGLAGGDRCSGGSTCDGTNGFSARLMWRKGGKAVLYLYHMDKPTKFGEDFDLVYPDGSNVIFTPGKWFHIAERVKINTDGSSYDGEVELWVNGQPALLVQGVRLTSNGDKVDDLYISTFHGGDDTTWCSTDTCYSWIDDVKIGTTYEDVAYKNCRKPEIGPDKTLCTGAKSVIFASDIQTTYRTYTWLLDGKKVGDGSSLSTWTPGRYILVVDSAGCTRRDTVMLRDKLLPNLGGDRHVCNTSFVTLDAHIDPQNLTFVWKKDGVVLPTKDSRLMVKDAGRYELTVSSPICNSATDSVLVTSELLKVTDHVGVAGDTVTLTGPDNMEYAWYESETGDATALGTSFQTHYPDGKTFVYVADPNGFNGTVGEKTLTSEPWTRSNFDSEWVLFTVQRELTIDSISIYPTEVQDVTIRILNDADGSLIATRSFEGLRPEECRLPIGVTLPVGTYRMDAAGTTAPLYYSHHEGISFPYQVDGLISINGCNVSWINAKPWYLFFYNWRVLAGNYCARTPILLTGEDRVELSSPASNSWTAYPTRTQGVVYLNGLRGTSFISVYSEDGRLVFFQKTEQSQMNLSLSTFSNSIYTLTVTDAFGSRSIRIVKE